jgi:hypothetical protein
VEKERKAKWKEVEMKVKRVYATKAKWVHEE